MSARDRLMQRSWARSYWPWWSTSARVWVDVGVRMWWSITLAARFAIHNVDQGVIRQRLGVGVWIKTIGFVLLSGRLIGKVTTDQVANLADSHRLCAYAYKCSNSVCNFRTRSMCNSHIRASVALPLTGSVRTFACTATHTYTCMDLASTWVKYNVKLLVTCKLVRHCLGGFYMDVIWKTSSLCRTLASLRIPHSPSVF